MTTTARRSGYCEACQATYEYAGHTHPDDDQSNDVFIDDEMNTTIITNQESE